MALFKGIRDMACADIPAWSSSAGLLVLRNSYRYALMSDSRTGGLTKSFGPVETVVTEGGEEDGQEGGRTVGLVESFGSVETIVIPVGRDGNFLGGDELR